MTFPGGAIGTETCGGGTRVLLFKDGRLLERMEKYGGEVRRRRKIGAESFSLTFDNPLNFMGV